MTQTQHTTRSCTSSCSSSDLQHAQQRRRRQMSKQFAAILLLLLISCSATLAAAAAAAATAQQSRFFYTAAAANSQGKARPQRQTSDAANVAAADATSCCQGAVAASAEPVTIALELGNVTADYSETDGSGESSKETFKRSVARAAIRNATPASCSPQPTIVELKPLTEQAAEQTAGNVYYSPACTRINRCNGCCGSTLISCQPTQVETLQLRVRKVERIGASSKRGYAIVNVDQHLACRCDCRIKAEDCNAYQEYRKDLCRCECQNTDERVKCQDQTDNKYWDDANCTCACRYNQSCTTGTVFDETQCKCTDPSAVSTDLTDRRRFIVQAVAVEEDNSTLYSV